MGTITLKTKITEFCDIVRSKVENAVRILSYPMSSYFDPLGWLASFSVEVKDLSEFSK